MPTDSITPLEVLKSLRGARAFREIRQLRVDQDLMEVKLAEVCAEYLAKFLHDQELRQTRDDLLARAHGALANARALNRGDLERIRLRREAKTLKLAARIAGESAGLKTEFRFLRRLQNGAPGFEIVRERLSTVRARRDGMIFDKLTVDLCVVLRRSTTMSIAGIVSMGLPPILGALHDTHPELLPKRGFSDPESRSKRFLKRARKAYLSKGQIVTNSELLENREHLLLGEDSRFRP